MADKLNWGLLSTADINKALFAPLRTSKRNRLLAVASRTQEKAEAYARGKKIQRAYGSYEELLADPEIDIIYNPLPNHLHAEWTIRAVEAGKHVLCEKPLALSIEEVDAMAAAAEKHGKVVAEALMYRSHPLFSHVRQMVADGKLGRVKMIRGSFTYTWTRGENYRLDPQMGGGSLWDVGVYPLTYARGVLGTEPLEVFGRQVPGPTGVTETFAAQLTFPGDVFVQFDGSMAIPYHTFMEFIGDEGALIVPHPFTPSDRETIYLTRKGKSEAIVVKGTETYVGEVEDMANAILDGKPQRVSLADSRANTAAILAIFESAETGKPVKM